MSLRELNENLYEHNDHSAGSHHTPQTFIDPASVPADSVSQVGTWRATSPAVLTAAEMEKKRRKWKIIIAVTIVVALIVLIALGVYVSRNYLFNDANVTLGIDGPRDVASAEDVKFTFRYGDANWLAVDNVTIAFTYPESFHLEPRDGLTLSGQAGTISLGRLAANSQGKYDITGKFYGVKGETSYINAVLLYSPKGTSERLKVEQQFGVSVATSSVHLDTVVPTEVGSGQEMVYAVTYRNDGEQKFSNIRIKAEYPDGFTPLYSDPKPADGNDVWYIGTIDPGMGGHVIIHGTIKGDKDEAKPFAVSIGYFQGDGSFLAYDRNEKSTRLIAPPLTIAQSVDDQSGTIDVDAGSSLRYSLKYGNIGSIGLRNVIVKLKLDSPLIDVTRLSTSAGFYDAVSKTILWKASDVPKLGLLEPGDQGEISLSIPIRGDIVADAMHKQFSFETVATIDSPDVPTTVGANKIIASDVLRLRLGTKVGLNSKILIADPVSPGTGPYPPKSGTETVYLVRVSAGSSLNDVKNAKMTVLLPSGARFVGKVASDNEKIDFNDRTNVLTWAIGDLMAGIDGRREILFRVGMTPGPNSVGDDIPLFGGATFFGTDAFIGKDLNDTLSSKTTNNVDDAKGASGFVQP